MAQAYVWCTQCRRAIPEERLLREAGGTVCPDCNRLLRLGSMVRTVCPACGAVMRCPSDRKNKVICPCQLPPEPAMPVAPAVPEQPAAPAEPVPATPAEPIPEPASVSPASDGPVTLAWQPGGAMDLAYRHPRGSRLQQADAVVVTAEQCVRFTAGGQTHWLMEPRSYSLGYEYREEQTVLRALMEGENLGVQPLLRPEVIFIDLRRHDGLTWEPEAMAVNGNAAVRPRVRYALTVMNPEALMKQAFDDGVPTMPAVTAHLEAKLRERFQDWLNSRFDARSTFEEIQQELKAQESALARTLGEAVGDDRDWGLRISDLAVECAVSALQTCRVCGAVMAAGSPACPNGHAVPRCPGCGDLLFGGRCGRGHLVVWCQYCKADVLSPDGRSCPVHGRQL